ncbi:MAG: PHP domain-containing protein [Verrucomicrobiota bacterium]
MPEFRIDLHCHSHFSVDGVSHPLQMIYRARELGLNGFVLTDHDTQEGITYLRKRGLLDDNMQAVDDFLVIPGMEVSSYEGHVLVIGAELEPMPGVRCSDLLPLVQQRGGICIAAHPFDPVRRGVGRDVLNQHAFDGIEVFNAASWLPGLNRRAYQYAKVRNHLMTAGSDSHHPASLGRSYQVIEADELSVKSLIDALSHGLCRRHEQLMHPRDYFIKSWYNMFRPKTPLDGSPGADSLL